MAERKFEGRSIRDDERQVLAYEGNEHLSEFRVDAKGWYQDLENQ